jgi:hypothetical protein
MQKVCTGNAAVAVEGAPQPTNARQHTRGARATWGWTHAGEAGLTPPAVGEYAGLTGDCEAAAGESGLESGLYAGDVGVYTGACTWARWVCEWATCSRPATRWATTTGCTAGWTRTWAKQSCVHSGSASMSLGRTGLCLAPFRAAGVVPNEAGRVQRQHGSCARVGSGGEWSGEADMVREGGREGGRDGDKRQRGRKVWRWWR